LAEDDQQAKVFTPEELAQGKGGEGKPIYVAFQGKVYEVTDSDLWAGGRHMGVHRAGADLTREFQEAPHDEEVLERYPQVGVLAPSEDAGEADRKPDRAREFWHRVVDRNPLLRRHPHPMVVHFPIVFLLATTFFTVLYLLTGRRSFEVTGFHCLGGGLLFTPVAMATGLFTWWLNYECRYLRPVVMKLILAPLLLALAAGLFVWRLLVPEILAHLGSWTSLVYLAGICSLSPLVSLVGWYGATLTFPLQEE
jgi:predicted heme/steroid binding protein/uncharacterized membrane protein